MQKNKKIKNISILLLIEYLLLRSNLIKKIKYIFNAIYKNHNINYQY